MITTVITGNANEATIPYLVAPVTHIYDSIF